MLLNTHVPDFRIIYEQMSDFIRSRKFGYKMLMENLWQAQGISTAKRLLSFRQTGLLITRGSYMEILAVVGNSSDESSIEECQLISQKLLRARRRLQ